MSSEVCATMAIVCLALAAFFFFRNTYDTLLNSFFRGFWYQAEKCFVNFELMFMDELFTMVRCRMLIIGSMIVCVAVVWYICSSAPSFVPLVAMLIAAIAGWILPGLITNFMHKRYVGKFDDQLLDALGLIASGLRSGLSLQQALGLVAKEMMAPASQEFKLLLSEYNYGKTMDEAFERMADRIPSMDFGITVEAVLVLRSTGGNLVETFEIIIDTVRERKKVEGKIKSITSLGVYQTILIGSMPFVLMWVLNCLNPVYMQPLYATTLGWVMIGITILLVILGSLLVKSIVSIKV
ncbi:type II secretion system F family protein [Desulfogranum japonicum]|uniref:type II secretion system F family protein n=1 Tax=Desulfogranum japonicum TaxID=231447 RepID=UPI0004069F44|nr:type II secretion system F family protein [Desulfogranum japonicum]